MPMETLALAASLGLASGLSPGPLFALVLSSTLERGMGAGLRIAVAPLLTDLLMLGLVSAFLNQAGEGVLRAVGAAGGLVVLWIGVGTLRSASRPPPSETKEPVAGAASDLWKGAAVNLLNPHAWIFWVAVGGPIVARTWPASPAKAGAFFLLFELFIVGSKAGLAWTVARARHLVQGAAYRWTLRILGLALLAFGVRLLAEAWP